MIANADVTLITLLEHKQLVFYLIDYADSVGVKGAEEFSVAQYFYLVGRELNSKSERERIRISNILSLENMSRNNLLAYWDKTADTFNFQPFVISMFRHLESHRLQELSDAELNGLHARLKEIFTDIGHEAFPWFKDDINYKERFAYIISTLRDINSRIDQNVASLKGQARTLAELVDKEMGGDTLRTEQVHQALGRIFDLVERYIQPTLRFLNPDLDWKGKDNLPPLSLFSKIMERFDRRNRAEERAMMSRIYWNLLQAADEIAIVRKGLDVYINLYDEQRRLYNAIEEKYNHFYNQIKELQDGKLRGNRIDPVQGVMEEMSVIKGLKSHIAAQSALINLPYTEGDVFLQEHLRVRLERIRNQNRDLIDAEGRAPSKNDEDILKRKRFKKLHAAAVKIKLVPDEDVYQKIHGELLEVLDDYSLADVIDAYTIVALDKVKVRIDLSSPRKITYDGKTLTYFQRSYIGIGA